ncbi:MAG: aldo/keto reductase [Ramlibacter sp.]
MPSTTSAADAGQFRIGDDIEINRLGYGAMRITGKGVWGDPQDPAAAGKVLRRLPQLGVNLIDTADSYGPNVSEDLIREHLHPYQGLLVATKGGKGRNGGADGDIYLHIMLAPHPVFRPDQHDLHFDLALAPWEAALGAEVEVPTLEGAVLLTVPPGTRSGRKLRLRGRGLANGRGGHGDLYANVHIDVPTTLSDRERELFNQLANASRFNPRAVVAKENA